MRNLPVASLLGLAISGIACGSGSDASDPNGNSGQFAEAAGHYVADSIRRQDYDVIVDPQDRGATLELTLEENGVLSGSIYLPAEFGPIDADDSPFSQAFTGSWSVVNDSIYLHPTPNTFLADEGWSYDDGVLRTQVLTDPQPVTCYCWRRYEFKLSRQPSP